jgi:hypothetical protein
MESWAVQQYWGLEVSENGLVSKPRHIVAQQHRPGGRGRQVVADLGLMPDNVGREQCQEGWGWGGAVYEDRAGNGFMRELQDEAVGWSAWG